MFYIEAFRHINNKIFRVSTKKIRNTGDTESLDVIFLFIWLNHWWWFCVSEALQLQCCFPLEPKPFLRLTVYATGPYFLILLFRPSLWA